MSNENRIMEFYEKREVEKGILNIPIQKLIKKNNERVMTMHIVYVFVWTQVCGGSKILLQHINKLSERNHKITIITYDEYPTWFKINENVEFIRVDLKEELYLNIPKCDLIVATSWKTISDCLLADVAPVVYFEQGGKHLFEAENLDINKYELIKNRFNMLQNIYTVSSYAKNCIKEYYKKDSEVILNAVDKKVFFSNECLRKDDNMVSLTTIGSEDFKFKNVNDVISAIENIKKKYNNINFNWITQTAPKNHKMHCIINPKQMVIGDILRNTDIYLCASEYESFGLPLLEAMSCGATVITTDTGGCRDIVKDNVNGLYVKKHDVNDMCEKIEYLINNKKVLLELKKNAIETAKRYSWSISIDALEEYYKEISRYEINNKE